MTSGLEKRLNSDRTDEPMSSLRTAKTKVSLWNFKTDTFSSQFHITTNGYF